MVNGAAILEAMSEIVNEKDISQEDIIDGIKEGFKKAYERFFDTDAVVEVDVNLETGMIELLQLLTVVQKVEDDWLEIGINQAKEVYGDNVAIGDVVKKSIPYNKEFSRLAVHQVRQIIQQKIRNASRERVYNRFVDKKGELITGKVIGMNEQGNAYLVDVDGASVSLWTKKMIPGDDFKIDDFLTFYIEDLEKDSKFSQIIGSRTAPGFLQKLLEDEIPEIKSGVIEVKAVSREPGVRSKVAVISHDENIEPIGSIVGVRGARINVISQQLHGEKIDVVKWSEDMNTFIINAMAPVRVISVDVDEENNETDVIVPNEQSSLAIGKSGMAARLVANLLHMKVNIISLTQAQELGIEVKWNGNISPEEVESKEFLENTKRRRNNAQNNNRNNFNNRNNNYRKNNNFQQPTNEVDLDGLQAFQQELLNEVEQENVETKIDAFVDQADFIADSVDEAELETVEANEAQANLDEIEQTVDDELDEYDDEVDLDDEYDEYYDK